MRSLRSLARGEAQALSERLWYRWSVPSLPLVAVRPEPLSRSQHGQDVVLFHHVFGGRASGFFVDIGAFDGETFSNSWLLEQAGWTGLCVEPNPGQAARCRAARTSETVEAAVGPVDGIDQFVVVPGDHGAMLSTLARAMTDRHRARVSRDTEHLGEPRTVAVQTLRLDSILASRGLTVVDLLLIDVEGSEAGVLASVDLSAIGNPVVLMENNSRDVGLYRLLRSRGYSLVVRIGRDELYVAGLSDRETR